MRLRITNVITGESRVCAASFSVAHAASSYGQPVLLVDGEPWGAMEIVLHNPIIVAPPKTKTQIARLAIWQRNLNIELESL